MVEMTLLDWFLLQISEALNPAVVYIGEWFLGCFIESFLLFSNVHGGSYLLLQCFVCEIKAQSFSQDSFTFLNLFFTFPIFLSL